VQKPHRLRNTTDFRQLVIDNSLKLETLNLSKTNIFFKMYLFVVDTQKGKIFRQKDFYVYYDKMLSYH
jgi:hypothetical protein